MLTQSIVAIAIFEMSLNMAIPPNCGFCRLVTNCIIAYFNTFVKVLQNSEEHKLFLKKPKVPRNLRVFKKDVDNCVRQWVRVVYNVHVVGDSGILVKTSMQ